MFDSLYQQYDEFVFHGKHSMDLLVNTLKRVSRDQQSCRSTKTRSEVLILALHYRDLQKVFNKNRSNKSKNHYSRNHFAT